MAPRRLDTALDELFGVPVESFVAKRDALASELKAAGDKEGAATVKAQHKPTVAAHDLNQLARNGKAELHALFAAAHRLASGKDFKAALETQRAALDEVRKKIPGAHAADIVGVLRGAMVDEALAKRVLVGQFSKLPEVQVGFFGAAPEPSREPRSDEHSERKLHAVPSQTAAERAHEKRERELAEKARKDQERAERELRAAERELERLSAQADEAEDEATQARRLATEAEEKATKARRLATAAHEKVQELRRRH